MKLYKTVLFILSIFVMLGVLSWVFPQPECVVGGVALRFPSMDNMLGRDSSVQRQSTAEEMLTAAEKSLVMTHDDSLAVAYQDSLAYYEKFFEESPARIHFPKGNVSYLFPFFEALGNADSVKLHIMHYGDSQIEGDRISACLRDSFQSKFGGSGPGVLPLVQLIGTPTVRQTLSDSLTMYFAGGMMGDRASHKRYGAMAQMARIDRRDTLVFSAQVRSGSEFDEITLFAGHVDSALNVAVGNASRKFLSRRKATRTWLAAAIC